MSNRILIVDDETNVRLNFRMTLETQDYEIFEARSGEEALEVLAERSFALAILDMRMPGMDGLELLAKMRESGIKSPGNDHYSIQRCPACSQGDETRRNRLPA